MGRRSTSSTKSGKFMNPTDQASKYRLSHRCSSIDMNNDQSIVKSNIRIVTSVCLFFPGKEARKRELKKVIKDFKTFKTSSLVQRLCILVGKNFIYL